MDDQVSEDQQTKLKIDGFGVDSENPDLKIDPFEQNPDSDEESVAGAGDEDEDEEEDEVSDYEFSFPSIEAASSPISAEDAFHNGQIRPTMPFFDDGDAPGPSKVEPLRKFFAAEEPEGTVEEIKSAAGLGRKSNSTGSSRLRRFRELIHRSSSDGNDAFVFLKPAAAGTSVKPAEKKGKKAEKKKENKASASSSVPAAHETLYGKNKAAAAAAAEKRRSYLPYRPGLVGFFTNSNGLSKNVHPF